jgi:hypothetical protein
MNANSLLESTGYCIMMTVRDDAAKGGSVFAQSKQSLAYPHLHGWSIRLICFLSIALFWFPVQWRLRYPC